jgi:chemotaxis family two-component system response regulator Rcp1
MTTYTLLDPQSLAQSRLIHILLVEDNPADVELTRQALTEAKVANQVHVAPDGVAAMQFLRGQEPYADLPRPDLVLLDLNLPKKSGREVLTEVKSDPGLCAIPVIVLTTSSHEEDILRAYEHHVNSYIRKPVRLDEFLQVVRTIDQYWLGIVSLPEVPPAGRPTKPVF